MLAIAKDVKNIVECSGGKDVGHLTGDIDDETNSLATEVDTSYFCLLRTQGVAGPGFNADPNPYQESLELVTETQIRASSSACSVSYIHFWLQLVP